MQDWCIHDIIFVYALYLQMSFFCCFESSFPLQLGLGLGLLHDRLHLGRLHNVTLDLELSTHEQTLGVSLSGDEFREVIVGEGESNYWGKDMLVKVSITSRA